MYQQRNTKQLHTDLLQQRNFGHQHTALPNNPSHSANTNYDTTADLTTFLAENELVFSRLTKFDDLPEHYQAWRETFINTIKNLELSAGEEMDLLIKWLGNDFPLSGPMEKCSGHFHIFPNVSDKHSAYTLRVFIFSMGITFVRSKVTA